MQVLLVTYDLNRPGQSYGDLYDVLKRNSVSWWHYLDSTWLLETQLTPPQMSKVIRQYLDQNDHILLIQVTGNYDGWLPADAWNWIKERLN